MTDLPEQDFSLLPAVEASPDQILDLLQVMESFDPRGRREVEVPLLAPIAAHVAPYVNENAPTVLRVHNPDSPYFTANNTLFHLGSVSLVAAVNTRHLRRVDQTKRGASASVTYDMYQPRPGAAGAVHHSMYASRSARITIRDDTSSFTHLVSSQQSLDEMAIIGSPVPDRKLGFMHAAGRAARHHKERREPQENPRVVHARESWVGAKEMAVLTALIRSVAEHPGISGNSQS
jgi:hypothetical protein